MSKTVTKAHVARLFYLDELSKGQIAAQLGISRFKVARVLAQARDEGIVRIAIDEPFAGDESLARELERRFELGVAVVTRDDGLEAVAQATAAWLPELIPGGAPLGVAYGATLARTAELVEPGEDGRDVVQVCGAIAGLEPGTGPVELAMRFADRLGARAHTLPAPASASRRARDELLDNDALAPTVALWPTLGLVLLGIGARLPGAPKGAAGHMLPYAFDAEGNMLATRASEQVIAISEQDLRRTRVVAACAGEGKEKAIAGALRTGVVDVLVCDARAARAALGGTL